MATAKKKPAPKTVARSAPAPKGKAQPSKEKAKPEVKAKPKRFDWEAIERDYRTGKFTLRELEKKHGPSYAEISRRSTKQGWTKDLRDIIKQATDAAVLREAVTAAQKDVTEAVVVAAEANKQVILSHRKDVAKAQDLARAMLNELSEVSVNRNSLQSLMDVLLSGDDMTAAQVADARQAFNDLAKLPTRILSVQRLAQAMTRLQALERTAFGLDEPEQPPPVDEVADLSDDELQARIEAKLERFKQS